MNDALDRLKKRSRPKVSPRDASLTSGVQDSQNAEQPDQPDIATAADTNFSTKRSTFRLETHLINRLHQLCRQQGISREVLIEAMFEYVEADPETMDQIMTSAQEKHERRLQIANRRRAEAMINKFGRG